MLKGTCALLSLGGAPQGGKAGTRGLGMGYGQPPFLSEHPPTETPVLIKTSQNFTNGHIQVQKLYYNHYIQSIQMTKFL